MASNLTRYQICDTLLLRDEAVHMSGPPSRSQAWGLSLPHCLHGLPVRFLPVADGKCSVSHEAPQLSLLALLSADACPHPVEACISLLPLLPSNWEEKFKPTKGVLLLLGGERVS